MRKEPMTKPKTSRAQGQEGHPRWYKDAVIYELHVRAFKDSDGDGSGDFAGLTEKLDYLSDLGVTALWLLPFYPSPLRDGGYDIADYCSVNPDYGTVKDFKRFLNEAHNRGLKVITEMVINHTSDQHPWFQRARRAPAGSRARRFYVWSETRDRYAGTRIIFPDFENSNWAWDPVAKAYYWHRFYSHQPDLNFDNPDVRRAILKVVDFWFGMGVDGMRLDAVPYLFEREGTNCENLPETHVFLKELRAHVDARFKDKMLLAEANQWSEDAAAYFGEGDECHMNFHFPLMPRLFMSLSAEDRFPLVDILQQTPRIPESCQWAIFLRNHDELTLEMVTDEERSHMYRAYAADPQARINIGIRRRLAPLLGNDRRKIELLNALLLSLPGTPVLYYGDEIGMGDNIFLGDRDGVRTPMQWSSDRNGGFSNTNPQRLYLPLILDQSYHYAAVNVETQQGNPNSLWWLMKRLIAMRNQHRAFGWGSFEFVYPQNNKVLAYLRRHEGGVILVVANLSRHAQQAEIELEGFEGYTPVELFGRTRFGKVRDCPYCLALNPYGFYWFELEAPVHEDAIAHRQAEGELPVLSVPRNGWDSILKGRNVRRLERALPRYLLGSRWFGGKSRTISGVEVLDVIWMQGRARGDRAALVLLDVAYQEGDAETYLLPVAFMQGQEGQALLEAHPAAAICWLDLSGRGGRGLLYDAVYSQMLPRRLLDLFARRRQVEAGRGVLATHRNAKINGGVRKAAEDLQAEVVGAEQSNTSIIYDEAFVLKLYRKLERGENPELEIGRFLTESAGFPHAPQLAGHISYEVRKQAPMTLGVLHRYVENHGDAWTYTLNVLSHFFDRILTHAAFASGPPEEYLDRRPLLERSAGEINQEGVDLVGAYVESARLLGIRTAEMHIALASRSEDPRFSPELFTTLYQRSLYQSMRNLARQTLDLLSERRGAVPQSKADLVRRVLANDKAVNERFKRLLGRKLDANRIRCHGDFHLGQVLNTGKDFAVIDFEGEPARSLAERQLKRSPFRDVAGMLRSFHYAAYQAFKHQVEIGMIKRGQEEPAKAWADFWYTTVSGEFLRSYMETAGESPVLAVSEATAGLLLGAYLLDKAVYELGYELNNRPAWVDIPLTGILWLVETEP